MIVLDTSVVSELMREPSARAAGVVAWFGTVDGNDCYVTSLTVAEVLFGLNLLPEGRRRDRLIAAFRNVLDDVLSGRVLDFNMVAAGRFAAIAADRVRAGRHIAIDDLRIAAIAGSLGMSVATRNVGDFAECGVAVVNPWEFSAP